MTELAPKAVDQQQIPSTHYYYEVKWRLLAEAPWLVVNLTLALIMSAKFRSLGDRFMLSTGPNIVPNIVTLGFLVLPMILLVASGDADLSSGLLAGLVCRIVAFLCTDWGTGLWIAAILSLLVALAVGLVNGLLVGFVKLKGIFVTFGMSFLLYHLIVLGRSVPTPRAPADLAAFVRSPLILLPWILLVLGCAALIIFTPLGRRPRAGEPEQMPLGLGESLSKALPFVFSSLMAWISGILLLGWLKYAGISAGSGFAEVALVATFLGGTAYYAGTGFVLSGAIALVAIVLFQLAYGYPTTGPRVILGALLLIMLPITYYYHIGVDWLYHRQSKKAKEALIAVPQQR